MRLELLTPPLLIAVDTGDAVRPALLLARRGDRRYVQLSHGAGANHLRWVAEDRVRPAVDGVAGLASATSSAPARGLPRSRR